MRQITPKRLSFMAMLVALQIVLSKFLMFQVTGSIRLSIDSVPILLAGIWFGPLAGGIVGVLSDLLGTLLFPTAGMYYPPLTVAYLLIGVCAGILVNLVHTQKRLLRAVFIVIPSEIAGSFLWKSFALSKLFDIPFSSMIAARALPVFAVAIINVFLVFVLDRLLGEKIRNSKTTLKKSVSNQAFPESPTMTYDEAIGYIHHVTWRGSRLGLERTQELLSRIGNPENSLKFIHIAGTNGKGSTAAMLANILRLSGYKTGLYISPFINRFNERMQLNGELISDGELAQITSFIRPHAEAMADHPTEFELITVIAFEYFRRHQADIVVLEVGMGGALDSTNVIPVPELAIITNIGLDHTRELGPTISDIARAKAGIIKNGGDVLIYGGNPEADLVFAQVSREAGARLHLTDHSRISGLAANLDALQFSFSPYGAFSCGLVGNYQANNAAVVITAVELLRQKGWKIREDQLKAGLASTRWPARFEILRRNPVFIADGGHNPQGIHAVIESLKAQFPGKEIVFLIGIMADKDIPKMIDQMAPISKEFITVTPNNPRAIDAKQLASLLIDRGLSATACNSIDDGVQLAVDHAGSNGIVCAVGSLYMLGDVRTSLGIQ